MAEAATTGVHNDNEMMVRVWAFAVKFRTAISGKDEHA
jgi:hypothetical protein